MKNAEDLWDRLAPSAGSGSSGRWTADLGGLPVSSGGATTREAALDALRAAHREAMTDPGYRALASEMAAIPVAVQRSAHPAGSGETMWRVESAAEAINALAAAGRVVLGLDIRDYRSDGSFVEAPWSSFEPTGEGAAQAARGAALSALDRNDLPGEWILVTWQS